MEVVSFVMQAACTDFTVPYRPVRAQPEFGIACVKRNESVYAGRVQGDFGGGNASPLGSGRFFDPPERDGKRHFRGQVNGSALAGKCQ
jgi:hypothetical protein